VDPTVAHGVTDSLLISHLQQVKRLKDLELENSRLRKAVSDLTLDKLILQEATRGNF
jgi:beta-lactamase class D